MSYSSRPKRAHPRHVVAVDPLAGDVADRRGVEIVQLLPAPPYGGDQIRGFQDRQVLADGLPGQTLPGAQLAQGLPGAVVEAVQQAPSARVSQRPEDLVRAVLSASWR